MYLAWVVLLPVALAGICPMELHQECNPDHEEHKCVCHIAQLDPRSAPQQSCNLIITRNEETFEFPAVSVTFEIQDDDETEEWPQEEFRSSIASSLRLEEEDIVILRVGCLETSDKLTIQFGILKKGLNVSTPYDEDAFIDADSIATRIKSMGHLREIGGLEVDSVKTTNEMIDIEFDPDNSLLVIEGIVSGIVFVLFVLLGFWAVCRNPGYQDDLQKA